MKNATVNSYFTVELGWVEYKHGFGEKHSDDPSVWEFENLEDAERDFAEIEEYTMPRMYWSERMCAGRGWRERDAYTQIKRVIEFLDEDGDAIDFIEDVFAESRYGCENYERDRA